jgi:3-phytase
MKIVKNSIFFSLLILLFISCDLLVDNGERIKQDNVKEVIPIIETSSAPSWGDNADDIAIWVNENDRDNSLIIGTLKREGLAVYDLNGRLLHFIKDGKFNNVDIRYNFPVNNRVIDIIAASNRSNNSIALYSLDKQRGRLFNIAARNIYSKLKMVYGLCMYHSESDNNYYVFATSKNGEIEQWRLFPKDKKVDAEFVNTFRLSSQLEGCVADDDQNLLFIGEEEIGVWKFLIEKGHVVEKPVLIDSVGKNGHLTAEVEGVALYTASGDEGYLIVSSQGASRFDIYSRKSPHPFIGSFKIASNRDLGVDGVSGSDGIDVINLELNDNLKYGFFIAQDDENRNPRAHQNFKIVPWENIAETLNLIKDNKYIYWY